MKSIILTIVLVLFSLGGATAAIGATKIWDLYVNVDYAYDGDETLALFSVPDGSGSAFNEAQIPDGTEVDATLRVQLLDSGQDPIADFPAEDMWLMSVDSGLISCAGGTIADDSTDEDGWTIWADPFLAGGWSMANCELAIGGSTYLIGWEDLALNFNSADISGDRVVNLLDIALFSEVFFGDYHFSADFYYDGIINLPDVGRMAHGIGASCP